LCRCVSLPDIHVISRLAERIPTKHMQILPEKCEELLFYVLLENSKHFSQPYPNITAVKNSKIQVAVAFDMW